MSHHALYGGEDDGDDYGDVDDGGGDADDNDDDDDDDDADTAAPTTTTTTTMMMMMMMMKTTNSTAHAGTFTTQFTLRIVEVLSVSVFQYCLLLPRSLFVVLCKSSVCFFLFIHLAALVNFYPLIIRPDASSNEDQTKVVQHKESKHSASLKCCDQSFQ